MSSTRQLPVHTIMSCLHYACMNTYCEKCTTKIVVKCDDVTIANIRRTPMYRGLPTYCLFIQLVYKLGKVKSDVIKF